MKQREVTDNKNVRWVCVQAYVGVEGNIQDKAVKLSENDEGKVPVVCTPTGGAQSVRLYLQKNWHEQNDEDLLDAIALKENH